MCGAETIIFVCHVWCLDNNICVFYVGEDPGWETTQQLISAIRNKGGSDEVLKVLEGLSNPLRDELAGDEMTPPYNPLQIQVFTQTILYLGSKSFSHSFAGITKFLKVGGWQPRLVSWRCLKQLRLVGGGQVGWLALFVAVNLVGWRCL